MKLLSLLLFHILLCCCALGQKQNNNWVFGNGHGLSFNTTPPSFIATQWPYIPLVTTPCAVSDAAGQLLFYSNGIKVWDRNHNIMPNGTDISATDTCISGVLGRGIVSVSIVPHPGSSSWYYIIVTLARCTNNIILWQSRYSLVDMNLNNGWGDIIPGQKSILLDSAVHQVSAATGNGICDKWIAFPGHWDSKIHAYRITTSGIQPTPVVSPTVLDTITHMKFSNNNEKLACITIGNGGRRVVLFDFDVTTGIVSNSVKIDSGAAAALRGVEFSPDNGKLYYYNMGVNNTREIYQVDITLPTAAAIKASKIVVKDIGPFSWSFDIMSAPDNKIYCGINMSPGSPGPEDFAVINHPDKAGLACDVTELAVTGPMTAQKPTVYNFHNAVPVTNIQYSYSDFNFCTLPATLSSHAQGAASYIWSTGATTPTATVTQNGTYWVRATQSCGAYRVDTFHVNFTPPIPIADTFSCNGASIQLPLDPEASYTWQSQGPLITQSGTYAVTISKGVCGTIHDTFTAIIYPPLGTPILPADTVVCNPAMTLHLSSLYDMGTYQWSTGATGRSVYINQPGTYWLQCNTPCGVFADTIVVSFCPPVIDSISFNDSICSGSCISFTPGVHNYPQSYIWSFTGGDPAGFSGAAPPSICYYQPGTFQAVLSIAGPGGSDTLQKEVMVLPKPQGRFDDTTVSIPYKSILLLPACTDAAQVSWYKDGELVCQDCKTLRLDALYHYNVYKCEVKNGDCTDVCTYTVHVTGIPNEAYLPTAFSPNGDGLNDRLRIITDNPNIYLVRLSVFNRYGELVYHATDNDRRGWDGYYKNRMAEMGAYYWSLKYRVLGTYETIDLKGDVTLVR